MSASVLVAVRPSGSRKVLVAAVCIDDRARSAVACRVGIRSAVACRGILPHEVARRGGHGTDCGSSVTLHRVRACERYVNTTDATAGATALLLPAQNACAQFHGWMQARV